jgi:Tfp pilus assembly PilM family ATPase
VVEPIFREIEVSLDLYLRQSANIGKRLEKVILTGGAALLPYLSTFIANRFKLKCYVGDPWARTVYQSGLKRILNKIGPRMSVAIGLALRNMI